jgi:hypothetical protein
MGRATAMAIAAVKKVPDTKDKIPKCFSLNNGVHWVSVKNSNMDTFLKKAILSNRRTAIIPIVVNIVIEAQSFNNISIIFSFIFIDHNSR